MTRRDVLAFALKILGLAFISHAVLDIVSTVDSLFIFHYEFHLPLVSRIGVASSWLPDVAAAIILLAFSDKIARRLMPVDEPFPAPTSPKWEPSVLSVSLRIAGTTIMALGIRYLAIVLCDANWLLEDLFLTYNYRWPNVVGVVLILIAAGYLMTGANALVRLLYPAREVGDARS